MNWDDARFFLAVLRGGSLSAAAKRLGRSHSTVRRRVAGLEESVGVRLFVASSDGLAPTDAATAAVGRAEALERAALDLERELSGRSREVRGRVRCTILDALADWIAPAIDRLAREHPGIEVELLSDNRHYDLARREADVAIRASDRPGDALVGRRVGRFEFAPFASRALIDRLGDDYRALPWALFVETQGAVLSERWYRSWAIEEPRVRVSHAAPLISLMRAGAVASLLPCGYTNAPELVRIGPVIEELGVDVWCVTHPDLQHSARVRALIDAVTEAAGVPEG